MHRPVGEAHHALGQLPCIGVAVLEGRDNVLGCGDPAEGVGMLLFGGALEEHRGMARVRDGVRDVVAAVQQVGVGRGGVEGEQDCARLHRRNDVGGDLAQQDVGDGQDDDVALRGGLVRVGHLATQPADVLLALGRVLGVENAVVALGEIVRNPLAHLASGTDDGDGGWLSVMICSLEN